MSRILLFTSCGVGTKNFRGANGPEIRTRELLRYVQQNYQLYRDISFGVLYPSCGVLTNDFEGLRNSGLLQFYHYEIKSRYSHFAALMKTIEKFQPDLIHVQGPLLFDIFTVIAARLRGCASIVTRPVVLSDDWISSLRRRTFQWLDWMVVSRANCLVAISKTSQKRWLKELGYSAPLPKHRVIYNGVHLKRFKTVPDIAPQTDLRRFGVIAQLTEVKGHKFIIKAIAESKLLKKFVHVLFVGDGPLRNSLEKTVMQCGLQGNISFSGFSSKVEEQLSNVDAVILPSLREGFPVSLIEAMAAGRPVIASDVGAVSELVDSKVGYLIPRGDVSALCAAMESMCMLPACELHAMGSIARRRASQYDLSIMADKYIKLYREFAK